MSSWVHFKPVFNPGMLGIIVVFPVIFLGLRRIIVSYLESKHEGRKTIMDQAHLFFLNSMTALTITFSLMRLIQQILDFEKSKELLIIAHVFDLIIQTLISLVPISSIIDLLIQFTIAIRPEMVVENARKIRKIFSWVRYGSVILILIIQGIIKMCGVHSVIYYRWIGAETKRIAVFQLILAAMYPLIVGIIRIILKFKFRGISMGGGQLLSNKVIFTGIIVRVSTVIFQSSMPDSMIKILSDLMVLIFTTILLILIIMFHRNLRSFASIFITDFVMDSLALMEDLTSLASMFSIIPFSSRFILQPYPNYDDEDLA